MSFSQFLISLKLCVNFKITCYYKSEISNPELRYLSLINRMFIKLYC